MSLQDDIRNIAEQEAKKNLPEFPEQMDVTVLNWPEEKEKPKNLIQR